MVAVIGACTSTTSSSTSTSTAAPILTTIAPTTTQAPTTTTSTTIPVETGVWRPIPEGPLSPRVLAFSAWTGEELIIAGGYDDDPCLRSHENWGGGGAGAGLQAAAYCFAIKSQVTDGAAFNPQTGTWRRIAEPPIPLTRGSASSVVQDGVVYILVGPNPGLFVAYHPAEDRWEELPKPTTRFGLLVEADDKLVLFRYDNTERNPDDWLSDPSREIAPDLWFDPDGNQWHVIPPDPLTPSFDRSMVWTGSELVLLGAEAAPQPGSEAPAFLRAAAYDFTTRTWRLLTDSNLVIAGGHLAWHFAAGRLINATLGSADGGETNPYDRAYPFGGILDLESGEWSELPDPPGDLYVPGALLRYAAVSPDWYLTGYGWMFNPGTGEWRFLPAPPDNPSIPLPIEQSAVLFAGPDLVVWGGFLYEEDGYGEMVNTGWMWRPEP